MTRVGEQLRQRLLALDLQKLSPAKVFPEAKETIIEIESKALDEIFSYFDAEDSATIVAQKLNSGELQKDEEAVQFGGENAKDFIPIRWKFCGAHAFF